jgi:hypothetical protein
MYLGRGLGLTPHLILTSTVGLITFHYVIIHSFFLFAETHNGGLAIIAVCMLPSLNLLQWSYCRAKEVPVINVYTKFSH